MSRPRRLRFVTLGLTGFIAIVVIALIALLASRGPASAIPFQSPLLGQQAPQAMATNLSGGTVSLRASNAQPLVVNFFASWCVPCRVEHPYLSALAGEKVVLVGINYKNDPAEANAWLAKLGNPYATVAVDREGHTGINFGVYGVPESYLIDRQGIIRFKQTGPWTPEAIEHELLPRIVELNR